MTFKNEAQLKRFLMSKCVKAVSNAERKVYEEFAGNLNQFYTEFKPEEYIRTGALFNSLEHTGATSAGNSVSAEVRFDTPSYKTGEMQLQSTPITGRTGWATWSGEQVLAVAMENNLPHGAYSGAGGTPIWTESMNKLGDIDVLLMQELKKQGI